MKNNKCHNCKHSSYIYETSKGECELVLYLCRLLDVKFLINEKVKCEHFEDNKYEIHA